MDEAKRRKITGILVDLFFCIAILEHLKRPDVAVLVNDANPLGDAPPRPAKATDWPDLRGQPPARPRGASQWPGTSKRRTSRAGLSRLAIAM